MYDYDDLIDQINFHLESNAQFQASVQKKYNYIMVDEYQDTNIPQKKLIDLLAENEDCSLMVVGDDNQSIYAFRGANYENILRFGEVYQNAQLIKLEQNYRSTPNVLDFINDISAKISLGYRKKLFSEENNLGNKPVFMRFFSEEEEAIFITKTIIKNLKRLSYKDNAILCRSSSHSSFLQLEFIKRKIPFKVIGGHHFLEKQHIKDIIAYIKILWNPFDAISWHRILTLLEGIGPVTAYNIVDYIKSKAGNLTELINNSYVKKNENLKLLCNAFKEANQSHLSIMDIFNTMEKYYIPILKKLETDWEKRIEDFKVIKTMCAEYISIEKFLSNFILDPPNEVKFGFNNADTVEDYVTISTIHSAKGLEWNTVFIIHLIDGLVPHYKSFDDYEKIEEERKLFYVACSRTKENLYLSAHHYSQSYAFYSDRISRFISEIDRNNYQLEEKFSSKSKK